MKCNRQPLLAALVLLFFTAVTQAQEPIRLARTPDISPDGKLVAFSYLGGIWTVETIGGVARPVTMHEAYHINPVFSPDGKWLAFTSNRHGSYDVFVVPVHGGKPRRLTFDSATDLVTGWSPDGKSILFSSNRSAAFPPSYEIYSVPFEGGRARRISADTGREATYSPKGDQIVYVRGPGSWYRKGYRGSSNDDIWISNADGTNNRRLTDHPGQDNSPMWSADGQTIYYVSDCCLSPANIVRQDAAAKSKAVPLTHHKDDAVRQARISANGEWIVYECGADLWVTSTTGETNRKLAIEVHADDKYNTDRTVTYTRGATEFAVSPDENHIAFSVHGELFLMPISGGKATRLTDHPAFDHGIAWAPDGKSIIFISDRNGHEDLYLLQADDPEHPEFAKAHRFKVKQLTSSPEPESQVVFAPDGKRVAFLRDGKLWTMNPDGTDQKVIVNETRVFDYDWSPDSKSLVYARMDGSFASDLYIIPAVGGAAKNVTRHATFNGDVSWSTTGNKIAFLSQRRRLTTMAVMSLQRPAATGAAAATEIDWDDVHLRVELAASIPAVEGAISSDGTKVAFRSSGASGDDLWVANSNGSQLTRVTTGNIGPSQIKWSKSRSSLIYFRDAFGTFRMSRLGFTSESVPVPFQAKMTIRRDEEFTEMFDQSWRALLEHFYDAKFHGADWPAIRTKYRPLLKHVATKEDLYALITVMMGELNASHLGISGFASTPDEVTADLGLLYDESYRGPGLKVAEILKRGPADRRGLNLKPGDIILSIDRNEITDQIDVSKLLNDKVGEAVVLQVTSDLKDPKSTRRIELTGVSRGTVSGLMYDRWVANNAKRVSELSKGTLGYIHIPSMDEVGLDKFVQQLYSDNYGKDAIVLDVRFNGGGFTHDQVLNYLGAKDHTFFVQRTGDVGAVIRSTDRKWTKPLVLLINNRSYSDAEIFPSAFKTLGLGKVVGQSTGGFVIGTSSIRLIDGSQFRVPRTGVFTAKGVNMEKEGVTPDIKAETHPDQAAKGIDVQLDTAVDVLLKDVVEWKKTKPGIAMKPGD
ncbi:MAG: PDZ domain-containing protein [Gemmataceae bacterium]|nr:PDZ domain-containing protein [Gemmataceae bacterium]